MQLKESYGEYELASRQKRSGNGRYGVCVRISRKVNGREDHCEFTAEDGILYILEIEAAKESVNLGRNLVDRGLVGF